MNSKSPTCLCTTIAVGKSHGMRAKTSLLYYQTLALVGILSPQTEAGANRLFMKLFLSLYCTCWAGLDTPTSVNMAAARVHSQRGEVGRMRHACVRHKGMMWSAGMQGESHGRSGTRREAPSFCLGGASQKALNQVNRMGRS